MKITDIKGQRIHLGKTSITVKGDDGKTVGVVTNCLIFSNQPPRMTLMVHEKFHLPPKRDEKNRSGRRGFLLPLG